MARHKQPVSRAPPAGLARGAAAAPRCGMSSDRARDSRERSLGLVTIAVLAVIAIAGLAFFIYLH